MAAKKHKPASPADRKSLEGRRKKVEATATFGLILIAVALIAPFASFLSSGGTISRGGGFNWMEVYKWVYAAGALIFTFARLVNVSDPDESLRIRRIRRLEFWAGMAFCIGGFFWFYNENKYAGFFYVGQLTILRDTVVFSLAGAMLQIVSSWMLVWRKNKEAKESSNNKGGSGK